MFVVPLFLILLTSCSVDDTAGAIQPKMDTGLLSKHCEYFIDDSAELKLRDIVISDSIEWLRPGFKELSFGWRRAAVLVRCLIVNNDPTAPRNRILLEWPVIDSWQVAYKKKSGIGFVETGDYQPMSERFKPLHFTFHVPVDLPLADVVPIYMRFKSEKPIAMPLSIHTETSLLDRLSVWKSIVWGMATPLVFCLLLNLLMYVTLRDSRFRFYIGFLFFFILFAITITGIGQRFIYGEIVGFNDKVMGVSAGLFTVCLTQFAMDWFKGIGRALSPILFVSYVGIVAAIIAIFDVYYATLIASANGMMVLVIATPSVLYAVFIRKWPEGLIWLFGIAIFCYTLVFWFLLLFGVMPPHILIYGSANYGAIVCSLILTLVIPSQVNRLKIEMQKLNGELNSSLAQVNSLHEQQKGDYMLTSFLLQPFQKKAGASISVITDSFVRQHKQFSYKEIDSEIGGDLCLIDRFNLANKPFTFFVNGDAMGKSLQGAGGAVVLGAAIQSQLAQTRSGKINTFIPELWLRDVYEGLHDLFLSFDGAMLMSFVMGLVDEEQSVLYLINTEHPFTVLFREKHPTFIEQEMTTRKLGTVAEQGLLTVHVVELMNDDKIIAGSDGRDDIYLHGGSGRINEDENLFLKWVSEGDGSAQKTAEVIQNNAELKDDLSLLSLHYQKPTFPIAVPAELESFLDDKEKQELLKCTNKKIFCRTLGNFASEAENMGDLSLANIIRTQLYFLLPTDIKNIRRLSAVLTAAEDYNQARRFSDCIVARNPDNAKALLNSALLYKRLGKLPYAKRLASLALTINPKMPQADDILRS